MAIFQCNFRSKVLSMQTNVTIILPENDGLTSSNYEGKFKTLYLLHGLSDDHTTYTRYTNIERYACQRNLAVVMPAFDHSFYTDMLHGHKYFTFLHDELWNFLSNVFPLSKKKEDNFIAGNSMGGYGSFKYALTFPERFAAAASMSGVMDINYIGKRGVLEGFNPKSIYGDLSDLTGTENDLYYLLQKSVDNQISLPKLLQVCGTEDYLYKDNVDFKEFAECLPIDFQYEESPGYHDWNYWEKSIQSIIKWLPID